MLPHTTIPNASMAAHALDGFFDTRDDCLVAAACLCAFARTVYAHDEPPAPSETRYFYGETTARRLRSERRLLLAERHPSFAVRDAPRGVMVVVLARLDTPRTPCSATRSVRLARGVAAHAIVLVLPGAAQLFFAGDGAGVLGLLERDAASSVVEDAGRFMTCGACVTCGSAPPAGSMFQACAQCRVARYCSHDCQRADWASHRTACTSLAPYRPCSAV